MLLRVGVPLVFFLILNVDKIECRKKSTSLTDRHTSHPNPVHLSYGRPNTISRTTTRRNYIQTTTPRYIYRTTTRRRYVTTTRKHRITTTPTYITTTPRVVTRYTTRRKTTTHRNSFETTTPRVTYTTRTRKTSTRATTPVERPPPFNPFFSTSQPKPTYTKPPPYNPFFSTTRVTPTSRQPAFNPFFTSSIRPLNSGLNKTTYTKTPPYNPFYSTTRFTPTTRQPAFNPLFTSSIRPLNSALNKTTSIPRQPAYNPYFTSSVPPVSSGLNKTLMNKPPAFKPLLNSSELPISGGLNKTKVVKLPSYNSSSTPFEKFNKTSLIKKPPYNSSITSYGNRTLTKIPPTHNSSVTSFSPLLSGGSNKSSDTKHSTFNYPLTSTRPPVSGKVNRTSITENFPFNHSFTSSRPPMTGKMNTTFVSKHPHITSPISSGPPASGGLNKTSKGHLDTGSGHKRNISSNFGQLHPNPPQGNIYSTYPIYPGHNSLGNYNPGLGYNTGGRQNQPSGGLTIINNNVNNYNHQVIYPTQHYGGYGRVPSGVTIINTDFNNIYPDSPRPSYHYTSHDTGRTHLGVYLGYRLGQISRPTYYYHGTSIVNNKYVPIYDHYEVHHYYHNKDSIPKEAEITANTIVTCAGDSTILCPENTTTLCTNNGAVLCISSGVVPCDKEDNLNCVRTSVPCLDSSSGECAGKPTTSISIPCISTARINGVFDDSKNTMAFRSNLTGAETSFCVVIAALPAEGKLPKPKKVKVEIKVPFHYTTNDSGIDPLGYYLGQHLEELESPSYLYLNYDKYYRYKEKFDHYDIHQYYHNGTIMPREIEIKSDVVMTCAGDSGTICPLNTRSLCFTDGAVACITDIESALFKNDTKLYNGYVNTSLPCENSPAPICRETNSTISMSIPCISIAKIYANVSNLISSVVSNNGLTKYYNTLVFQISNSTTNATVSTVSTPRQFCVTVLLTPSEKMGRKAPTKRKVTGINNDKIYRTVPSYTYRSNETGTNTLGFYLSQRLKNLKYPTYHFMPQNDSIQKFDHYSVHQYSQGREIIPKEIDLLAESISACSGDSGTLCPANTTNLCLNDWSIMCVTDILLTKPYEKTKNTNCVRSTLPCLNSKAPKCTKDVERIRVTMPCISTVTVFGDIMYVNNSIYTSDITELQSYVSIQQIPNRNGNASASYYKAQQFCVTIVAIPAERRISDGEKILESSKNVFFNFALNMFGI